MGFEPTPSGWTAGRPYGVNATWATASGYSHLGYVRPEPTLTTWEGSGADADGEADAPAGSDSESGLHASGDSGSVGARVDSVLAAAEQAAKSIQEEAREWAHQHKEESRRRAEELAAGRLGELSSLAEDLRSRAEGVAKECGRLIKSVQEASSRPAADDLSPKLRIAGSDGEEADEGAIPDRARLVAAQMIAAGDSREEISHRLRDEFGIQDASAMLDRMGA
jgi:hypothetical protein